MWIFFFLKGDLCDYHSLSKIVICFPEFSLLKSLLSFPRKSPLCHLFPDLPETLECYEPSVRRLDNSCSPLVSLCGSIFISLVYFFHNREAGD